MRNTLIGFTYTLPLTKEANRVFINPAHVSGVAKYDDKTAAIYLVGVPYPILADGTVDAVVQALAAV